MSEQSFKKAGGKYEGAGRKPDSSLYQETTTVMRIPISQKTVISDLLAAYAKK